MKLTPMDIKNKEFKKAIRGYAADEVDEFMEEIVENYEELFKENSRLKDTVSRIREKVEHYEKLEDTIQNTLLLAQNAADQAKESSQKEADLIMKNANESAQKVLDKAHNDVIAVNDFEKTCDIYEVKRQANRIKLSKLAEKVDILKTALKSELSGYSVKTAGLSMEDM